MKIPTLPERRSGEDRRKHPGNGYGLAAAGDPDNRRVAQRRSWKKRPGRADWKGMEARALEVFQEFDRARD